MKIVVVSDNHGYIDWIEKVRNDNLDADYFIHLGDNCTANEFLDGYICVRGNNDYNNLDLNKILKLKDHTIFITHGHRLIYGGKKMLSNTAKNNNCDIVLYGHTHIFDSDLYDDVYLFNPGSIRSNRDFSLPSYGVLLIKDNNIEFNRIDLALK